MSLHKLYKLVMERGGYDQLSNERMAWRSLVRPFGFSSQHEGAMTFQIKTLYYKNLAYALCCLTSSHADLS
jgi:chromatin structure-remodeling complex subunit RSC9